MIKKFVSSSVIYAGSALLFSVIRQLIFFPLLNKISPDLFVQISFIVILIDLLVYTFGASIADYYVRLVTKVNKQLHVFKFLIFFSFSSFFFMIPVFLFYELEYMNVFILTLYVSIYIVNTLQLKVFFNNLDFRKNYWYVSLRVIPYLLLLGIIHFFNMHIFNIFLLLLLIFEMISFTIFHLQLKMLPFNYLECKIEKKYEIIKFIFLYFLLALTLRLDMFAVEYFYPSSFAEYYQMVSVFMIAVNPIILLSSSSLLSVLTHVELNEFIRNKNKIFLVIILISSTSGILFYFIGPYIIEFIYPQNDLLLKYNFLSFIIIFFTLIYLITRTFLIKYGKINKIIYSSILMLVLPLLYIDNMLQFIFTFYFLRGLNYSFLFLRLGGNND